MRKHLRGSNQPHGVQSLSQSRSSPSGDDGDRGIDVSEAASTRTLGSQGWATALGQVPELFEAQFAIAWRAADGCTDENPRQLLQLMLGAVCHKKRNTEPWSRLPWGMQPELIKVSIQTFGTNFIRDVEQTINRRMNEEGDDRAFRSAMSVWLSRQSHSQTIDPADRMAAQEQIDELNRLRSRAAEQANEESVVSDSFPATNDDDGATVTPAHAWRDLIKKFLDEIKQKPGWAQFKNVSEEVAANLVRRVQYEADQIAGGARSVAKNEAARQTALGNLNLAPPDDLIVSDLSGAASVRDQLEAWLDLKKRESNPSPDQVAWVAKTLWETQQPTTTPSTKTIKKLGTKS